MSPRKLLKRSIDECERKLAELEDGKIQLLKHAEQLELKRDALSTHDALMGKDTAAAKALKAATDEVITLNAQGCRFRPRHCQRSTGSNRCKA
jgi:hypothetical protein